MSSASRTALSRSPGSMRMSISTPTSPGGTRSAPGVVVLIRLIVDDLVCSCASAIGAARVEAAGPGRRLGHNPSYAHHHRRSIGAAKFRSATAAKSPTSHYGIMHTVLPWFGVETPPFDVNLDVFSSCRESTPLTDTREPPSAPQAGAG
jgi:hypothetical protein